MRLNAAEAGSCVTVAALQVDSFVKPIEQYDEEFQLLSPRFVGVSHAQQKSIKTEANDLFGIQKVDTLPSGRVLSAIDIKTKR